jgi:hypothetical protein
MSLLCPKCQSEQVVTRNYARKTGGAIGTIAGGIGGLSAALSGARLGSAAAGMVLGPGATRCRLRRHARCDPRWSCSVRWPAVLPVLRSVKSSTTRSSITINVCKLPVHLQLRLKNLSDLTVRTLTLYPSTQTQPRQSCWRGFLRFSFWRNPYGTSR